MKFDDTNSLVVLDDQSNSKKFNSFKNIETVNPRIESYFPIRGTVEIGLGKKKFDMEAENRSYDRDWDWDANPDGPPKDDEEIFSDFFGEMFFSNNRVILNKYLLPEQIEDNYSGYYIFSKKKYLDSKNNYVFNNIKFLYFYTIGKDFFSFIQKKQTVLGKAGRARLLGKRPAVRGIAMNPVDHPHGGKGNGGRAVTPWAKPTRGKPTSRKN